MNTASIGIFDSGFGGLTVMKAIRDLLPHENIVYFGDTAHLPYGTKSGETILKYSIQNTAFLIEKKVKVIVVACHTACSFALKELQKKFSIPIIGVTEAPLEFSPEEKIAVLGTRGTITSGAYQKWIKKNNPTAQVTGAACQLLVNLVEEGFIDHPITNATLEEYLSPLSEYSSIVLGCTHFPLLHQKIQKFLPRARVVDPAPSCAQHLKRLLQEKNLLNPQTTPPVDQFFVSDDPEKFRQMGRNFLGSHVESVKLV